MSQGWHGDKGRHSKAAKLGWLRRWGQRRALRKRGKRIAREVSDMQALINIRGVLKKIKKELEQLDPDKRKRIGVLLKPYKDRTVTHRVEMKWNHEKGEWEVAEAGTVVARKLGSKTLFFIEPEK